jgi:uncharacterized protein involved in oxidation of intracellular sulfur
MNKTTWQRLIFGLILADNGGKILACGTCLKIRQQGADELCPLSTMQDLYELTRDSDKVLTF